MDISTKWAKVLEQGNLSNVVIHWVSLETLKDFQSFLPLQYVSRTAIAIKYQFPYFTLLMSTVQQQEFGLIAFYYMLQLIPVLVNRWKPREHAQYSFCIITDIQLSGLLENRQGYVLKDL